MRARAAAALAMTAVVVVTSGVRQRVDRAWMNGYAHGVLDARGRQRCRECHAVGGHKMDCSRRL